MLRPATFVVLALLPRTVRAAEVTPLAPAECRDLSQAFAKATGLALTIRDAPITVATMQAALLPEKTTGSVCMVSGRAKGLRGNFASVEQRVAAVLKGWTAVPEQAADGPAETIQGFRRGNSHVVFSLTTEPPAGRCATVVLADCKTPRAQWNWTFAATAYQD